LNAFTIAKFSFRKFDKYCEAISGDGAGLHSAYTHSILKPLHGSQLFWHRQTALEAVDQTLGQV
jgi:hypothetical protein